LGVAIGLVNKEPVVVSNNLATMAPSSSTASSLGPTEQVSDFPSVSPTCLSDSPSFVPTSPRCFESRDELRNAILQYLQNPEFRNPYGHPLNTWCISAVTNMDRLLENIPSFNKPLGDWDTSHTHGYCIADNHTSATCKAPTRSPDTEPPGACMDKKVGTSALHRKITVAIRCTFPQPMHQGTSTLLNFFRPSVKCHEPALSTRPSAPPTNSPTQFETPHPARCLPNSHHSTSLLLISYLKSSITHFRGYGGGAADTARKNTVVTPFTWPTNPL